MSFADDLGQEIKKRQAKKKLAPPELYSITCEHVILAPVRVNAILLKVGHTHPKHDGKIYVCEACAFLFDKFNIKDLQGFTIAKERDIMKHINKFVER